MQAERRESLILWCAAAVLAAGIIPLFADAGVRLDEGFHLLAAQLILKGKRPYLDFLHPQAPLYAYWNAALMWAFWPELADGARGVVTGGYGRGVDDRRSSF